MIQAQRGDNAYLWVDDVRGIQTPSKPYLHHCKIDLSQLKVEKGQRRGHLEGCDAGDRVNGGLDAFDEGLHPFSGDRFSINLHPLSVRVQMGGGVEAGFQSGGLGGLSHHHGDRPFTFGAGDMEGGIGILWVPQLVEESDDAIDLELSGAIAFNALLLVIDETVKVT